MADETTYNPNDPEFLLSRSLDETLSEEEQRILDEALASSAELREEATNLRKVRSLVEKLGEDKPEADWDAFTDSVAARCESDDLGEESEVDVLLQRWGKKEPEVDWNRFTSQVMNEVATGEIRSSGRHWIWKIGGPLAAAAAVALAMTGYFWQGDRAIETVSVVQYERHVETSLAEPVSRVSYSRQVLATASPASQRRGIGFSIVSAGVNTDTFGSHASP